MIFHKIISRTSPFPVARTPSLTKRVGIYPSHNPVYAGPVRAEAENDRLDRAARTKTKQARHTRIAERLVVTSMICDAVVVLYALLAAYWLKFCTPLASIGVTSQPGLPDYAPYIAFGTITLILTLAHLKLYSRDSLLRYRHVSMIVAKACAGWFLGFLGVALIFKMEPPISRGFVILAGANALAGLLIWRNLFHRFLRRSVVARSLRQRVLVVGWNAEAERLSRAFEEQDICAYEVAGCVVSAQGRLAIEPADVSVLGTIGDLEELIHHHEVDTVMVADLDCVKGEIVGIANLCEREMVRFQIVPSYFQILVSGLHLETVGGIPVLGVSQLPLDRLSNILLKRLVDIVGSIFGLIALSPVMAFFCWRVKRESPGPAFYKQRRLGRNGREFDIYKIRSMKLDAEKDGQVGWSTKSDDRRLKIGELMRRYNIDELPQFWNVLQGEMSLVGPRPERPELIRNFKSEIPHYNARHNALPGITGWAQVKGFRGDTDLGERIQCDLFYLENWNLMLDLQIMVMTLTTNKNAA